MLLAPENPGKLKEKLLKKKLVIYGAGYVGKLIANWCDTQNVSYVFSDSKITENSSSSITLESLKCDYADANVVIASINYYDEIKDSLQLLGFSDNQLLSYLLFWTNKIDFFELEDAADWDNVRQRAEIFAKWLDSENIKSVSDYSMEKQFLREFLKKDVEYFSPNYIKIENGEVTSDFTESSDIYTDAASCLAVLMSFQNPDDVITHICRHTKKRIVISYVPTDKLSGINFRRSINYVNDFSERQLIDIFADYDFFLKKQEIDPFDVVHNVYMFEKG